MMMRILEGGNEEMFHLVIDLEMCKVPRDYRSKSYRYARMKQYRLVRFFLMIHSKESVHFANMSTRSTA